MLVCFDRLVYLGHLLTIWDIVFQELPASDKSRLLSQLAAKAFSHAVGS
jgi:hypothetical protein